jgi:TPR repeat protein
LQDCTLATKWLSEAAFGGNADAAKEIATLIEQGRCFDPSERRALVWDELAAENGDTEAPNAIREIYLGRGDVPANLAKAAVWFRIGAMAFDANAYHHLGEMYSPLGGSPPLRSWECSFPPKIADKIRRNRKNSRAENRCDQVFLAGV